MPARTGGAAKPRPVVVDREGQPIERTSETHPVMGEKGELHAKATLTSSGFMSAEQVHDLEGLKGSLPSLAEKIQTGVDAALTALRMMEEYELPKHDHPELTSALKEKIAEIEIPPAPELPPPVDLSGLAPKDHSHPLEKHDHPELREELEAIGPLLSDLWKAVDPLAAVDEAQAAALEELKEKLDFVRQLAEEAKKEAGRATPIGRPSGVPPGQPWITNEDGHVAPLPPRDQLHGINLPGGNLHRTATEKDAGFMSPVHVERLNKHDWAVEQTAREYEEVRKLLEEAQGRLSALEIAEPEAKRPDDLEVLLNGVRDRLGKVEDRLVELGKKPPPPLPDLSGFASRGHGHPELAGKDHAHPELAEPMASISIEVEDGKAYRAELDGRLSALEAEMTKAIQDLAFVRKLAEQRVASSGHGHEAGGALHQAVTPRLAGFMKPEHLRTIDDLKARVEALENPPTD